MKQDLNIQKTDGSGEFTLLATLSANSYSDTDTTEGVEYSYYVVSYNDNGESAKSKVVTATQDSISPTVVSTIPRTNKFTQGQQ